MEQNSLAKDMVTETIQETQTNIPEKKKSKLWIYLVLFFILIILGVGGYWYYSKGQALLLIKEMKWNFNTELKNYKVNSNTSFEIKDFNSVETIPFIDTSKGLKFTTIVDSKIIDNNKENNIELTIGGLIDADIKLDIKQIGDDIYIKPKLNINNEMIDTFLSKFDIKEDEWLFISKDNSKSLSNNYNIHISLERSDDFEENIQLAVLELLKEKILIIKDTHNDIDSKDGILKEIHFSMKEGKFKDSYLIIGKIFGGNEKDLLKEFDEEKYQDISKVIESIVSKIELSLFINKETKYVQGIGFDLSDIDISTNDYSFVFDISTNTLLETIDEFNIDIPDNIVTIKEVFEDRPKIKEAKDVLNRSLIPLMNCLDEDKDINKPKGDIQEICEIPFGTVITPLPQLCDGSINQWFNLPQGYIYANYSFFDKDQDSDYIIEYCAHHNELSDIKCTKDGCIIIEEECKTIIDIDGDGLSEEQELNYGTDPNNSDTDGDGYLDGEEVENGYNPSGPGLLE